MEMIKKVPPLVCKGEKNLTFYHDGKLMITPGKVSIVHPILPAAHMLSYATPDTTCCLL